ncbi:MAG: helix-turn-helix domain-containing protein [Bacteroidetes bacterium]|nr:helix-turn-helix domain-containing protein [Bacteroidota bacterium]
MVTDAKNQLVTVADLELFRQQMIDSIKQIVKQTNGPKKWLKSSEVRKMIGVSSGKLQAIRESGLLAFTRIGGNIYYDPDDVYRLFEENKTNKNEI